MPLPPLGRRDTLPTPPVRPGAPQSLQTMLKSITSSQFSPPLNTAVTGKKKNWLKRQRKTLKLVKEGQLVKLVKKTPKKLPKKKPVPAKKKACGYFLSTVFPIDLNTEVPKEPGISGVLTRSPRAWPHLALEVLLIRCSATGA